METNCNLKCEIGVNLLRSSTLYAMIEHFTSNLEILNYTKTKTIILGFYDFLKKKYGIKCEIGMLFIEKMLIENLLAKYNLEENNVLFCNKVEMYSFVKPQYLKIEKCNNLSNIISEFKKMTIVNTPSVKIFFMMQAFKTIYKNNPKIEYDSVLGIVIYTFLKLKQKNIYSQIRLMKYFKRKYNGECIQNCCHGFSIDIKCNCLVSRDFNGEEEYYIITCEAACKFIEKIEYASLKIDKNEFLKEAKI